MRLKNCFGFMLILGGFIIVFNPPLLSINSMHLVGLVSLFSLFFICITDRNFAIGYDVVYLVVGYTCLLILICIVELMHYKVISNVFMPIYYLLDIIPYGLCLTHYGKVNDFKFLDYIKFFVAMGLVQGALAITAFVFPSVKEFFCNRLINYGYEKVYRLAIIRFYGFAGDLLYSTAVVLSILSIFCFYIGINYHLHKRYYLYAFVLFFSAFINARISFIVMIVGSVSLLLISRLPFIKKIIAIGIFALVVLVILPNLLQIISQYNPDTFNWLNDGIDEIQKMFRGDFSGVTVGYLTNSEKYKLPDGVNLIFGCGYFVMGGYDYASDIGFINDIWYGGIIYLIFKYAFYYYPMLKILLQKIDSFSKFIIGFYMVLLPILNVKGIAFMMNDFMNLLIMLIIIIAVNKTKIREVNNANGYAIGNCSGL